MRKCFQLFLLLMLSISGAVFAIDISDITLIPKTVLDAQGYSGTGAIHPLDGSLHVAWINGYAIRYRIRTVDGNWLDQETIPIGVLRAGAFEPQGDGNMWPRNALGLFIDENGLSHLVFNTTSGNGSVYYLSGVPGAWDTPELIAFKGNNTTYAQIAIVDGIKYVTYLDVDDKEAYWLQCVNGVWSTPEYMFPADNPNLAYGENGMVYFVAREFVWLEPSRYNAIFGYLIPGFTGWNYSKYVTDAERRGGKEASIGVGGGRICVGWNNSTGVAGPSKGELFCAMAAEPGISWTKRLGGSRIYTENTGDTYCTATLFSDGTPMVMNGKEMSERYILWNGKYWTSAREGDWQEGHLRIANDGRTAWVIASNTRYSTLPVTVTGLVNTKTEARDFTNKKPVITTSPDTLALKGYAWSTQVSASDPDGDALQYKLTYKPGDMSVNASTGLVQWTPPSVGTHIVGVKAYDADGAYDAQYFRLHVVEALALAQFSAGSPSGYAPHSVQFTDQSMGIISTWAWDFGDGQTSSEQNPGHIYTNAGIYSVTLTVEGDSGSDTLTKTGMITVTIAPPAAGFDGSPLSGTSPLMVQFTDQSIGNVTAWSWDFGDGGTSSVQNPFYTYLNPGTYTVTLSVQGSGGSDTLINEQYISVNYSAPSADFNASLVSGNAPLHVQFTTTSTGMISSYAWDFGDGQVSTVASPDHYYILSGTYTVQLTVTGPGGSDTEQKTALVTVYPETELTAAFTAEPVEGFVPLAVSFQDQSVGSILSRSWYFGDSSTPDGGTSTEINPTYIYSQPGTYTVILTVVGPDTTVNLLKHNYITASATGVSIGESPDAFALYPNHPNPFNMQTMIRYDLPEKSDVEIRIYDASGRTILEMQIPAQDAGQHQFIWNGMNSQGQAMSSGIYMLKFRAGDYQSMQKLMLIK